jgi:hypothetical protein
MGTETYKKEQERIEKAEREKLLGRPEEEAPEPMTVAEIMGDNEKSSLFGKMLERDGDPTDKDVVDRLINKKLQDGDVEVLQKYGAAFEKKWRRVEGVNEELTPELIKEVASQSPDFKKILGVIDSDRATAMFKDRMADLAFTDPALFDKIYKSVDNLTILKKGGVSSNDKYIEKMCKDNNIDEGLFSKALAIKDDVEREDAIREIVRSSWGKGFFGGAGRFFDVISFGAISSDQVEKMSRSKGVIDGLLAELDVRKKKIGNVLASTVKGSPDMLNSLSKAVMGESTKVEQAGLKKVKEGYPKEQQIDVRYGNFKRKIFNVGGVNKTWANLSDTEKTAQKQIFADEVIADSKKTAKAGGFWASIAEALFGAFLVEKMKKLD